MRAEATAGQGPWSRFARAFSGRVGSRWAWRALVFCIGLAVLAPWLANERPYFASLRDSRGYADALAMIVPITEAAAREARAGGGGFPSEARALRARLEVLREATEFAGDAPAIALREFEARLEALEQAVEAHAAAPMEAALEELRQLAPRTLAVLAPLGERLVARASWPLFASLSVLDIAALGAWIGLASMGLWSRALPGLGIQARLLALAVFALVLGGLWQAFAPSSPSSEASAWKARIAADPMARAVFAPIAFGPGETALDRVLEAPLADRDRDLGAPLDDRGSSSVHWCGTDALGRDLLARMLFASRTSFAVAFLAAVLIVSIGSVLGLAAGTLRGIVDAIVTRAIELLQALPTLVVLLGWVALMPVNVANSRWTMPLVIAALGWTHVARLARAEALRVNEMGFVQAALASGFPRRQVLFRHVLPNSLGPVWIAASFVLSAGLILESAAAFLGFGIQLPAPSFGALLADARASQAWWLALFPGLWLFASILAIHLVGEGVRAALDPRDEGPTR